MPQIIVTAGDAASLMEGTVMLRERINASDFESDRFAVNLIERLGWAVSDAIVAEEQEDSDWVPEARHQQGAGEPKESRATKELVEA